jgi:phenylacetate-CoA ligase
LELSQWYRADQLRTLQFRQLDVLIRHAHDTVPYYRERWAGIYDSATPLSEETFARFPVLTRGALLEHFATLKSAAPPAGHGKPAEVRSSGSSGRPVRVLKTPLNELLWQGVMLREHLWHGRDLGARFAVIRRNVQAGEVRGLGGVIGSLTNAGVGVLLPVATEIGRQLAWLEEQQPDYLLTYPSNVAELARLALERGTGLPKLREIMTMGEVVSPELRALCRTAWNVPVVDAYSAEEVGYLALQCPDCEHYHVQAETAIVEILNTRGKPCAPGETGLVIVTPLHGFAMPLVRYAVGDYATAGKPCPCGRGLPVLERVMGRTRNTLVLESGERYWPFFGTHAFTDIAPILQHQFVQKSYGLIEARLVTGRALTRDEEEAFKRHVQSRLPAPFEIRLVYVPEIARTPGGKFEDLVSEIADRDID